MQKSSKACLPTPKNFLKFPGRMTSHTNPNFQVSGQDEPTMKEPIKRRHAMAGAKIGIAGTVK